MKNRLSEEESPYLRQHKDNPVFWQAWNEESLQMAKEKDLPIFLSIGYSTCHWCHVMERESFENTEVAEILNKSFIPIKVDREERPDIDMIYMRSIQVMGQNGGWPLSIFLTPDLKPFWGGTYFTQKQFQQILRSLSYHWMKQKENILKQGDVIEESLTQFIKNFEGHENFDSSHKELRELLTQRLNDYFDYNYGGFSGAPKFPPTMKIRYLLRESIFTQDNEKKKSLTSMIDQTLVCMFQGGIYDHLGGGFSRYSTDEMWLIPHFEKMLYDNANLSLSYLEAYQFTSNQLYLLIAKDIFRYLENYLYNPEGVFYSAEDADSEGVEGKYYIWSHEEIKSHLTKDEWEAFNKHFHVTDEENFMDGNVLNLLESKNLEEVFSDSLLKIKSKLESIRSKRIPPLRDKKVITSWNGLIITSYARAFQITQEEHYLEIAKKTANFILKNHLQNKELKRRSFEDSVRFAGCLDDYVYLIQGLLELYHTDFDTQWVQQAHELQNLQIEKFWNDKRHAFHFTTTSNDKIVKPFSLEDDACPSPNATSITNLLKLSIYMNDIKFHELANKLLATYSYKIKEFPLAFIQAGVTLFDFHFPLEIAILGDPHKKSYKNIVHHLQTTFLPTKVISTQSSSQNELPYIKDKESVPKKDVTVHVCLNKTCYPPIHTLSELKKLLKEIDKKDLHHE